MAASILHWVDLLLTQCSLYFVLGRSSSEHMAVSILNWVDLLLNALQSLFLYWVDLLLRTLLSLVVSSNPLETYKATVVHYIRDPRERDGRMHTTLSFLTHLQGRIGALRKALL